MISVDKRRPMVKMDPAVSPMRIEVHEIKLTPYDEEIHFRILLPQGYDSSAKRYPVIYLNDGQWLFGGRFSVDDSFSKGESLQYAAYYNEHAPSLPEVILVGIDSLPIGPSRTNVFGPPVARTLIRNDNGEEITYCGTGNLYSEWIVRELKPYIDKQYRTKSDRQWTAVGGFSSGANSALYTQLSYPGVFSRVLMFGSSVWLWDFWFEAAIANSASCGFIDYLFMLCGTDERTIVSDRDWTLAGNRSVFDKLIAQGVSPDKARFYESQGGQHSLADWRPFFPDALRWVFQDLL